MITTSNGGEKMTYQDFMKRYEGNLLNVSIFDSESRKPVTATTLADLEAVLKAPVASIEDNNVYIVLER